MSYSNNLGKYQYLYDKYNKELIPQNGQPTSSLGLLLSDINYIYYRYFNDGDSFVFCISNYTFNNPKEILSNFYVGDSEDNYNEMIDNVIKYIAEKLDDDINSYIGVCKCNKEFKTKTGFDKHQQKCTIALTDNKLKTIYSLINTIEFKLSELKLELKELK